MEKPRESPPYNDGENVTHYLGNDDYSGNNLDEYPDESAKQFDGKVAAGNDLDETEEELSENFPNAEDLDYE
jgi:hypothetical protein